MNIRSSIILVIVLTNLIIIIFSISTGIIFVKAQMELSIESDLTVMANIADHFLSAEIELLKFKADAAAKSLEAYDESRWREILPQQLLLYPEFTAMAVIDYAGELTAGFGGTAAYTEIVNDKNIRRAFNVSGGGSGKIAFTSTIKTDNGVVFYMAAPLWNSSGKILLLTLPGTYFSKRLSKLVIWETGHVYMSDSEGYAIANPRENWLHERFNYIQIAQTDNTFKELAQTVTRMTMGETGIGYYSINGIQRICSFRPVSGSEEGWSLGVLAPNPENPARNLDRMLFVVAVISILLNIIAAVIASGFLKKPFERIAILKNEADAANKAKSIFLSTMSHEIRTPMNAILGISEIQLQKESLDPLIKEAFIKIFTSGDLLLSIINDILDLSKIEAGKLELMTDEYEIASTINDTTQLNMLRIGSKFIKFELDINENIPSRLMGDELRIKQILNNLLSNAFKYTEEGIVRLSVNVEDAEDNNVTLVIIVKDSGQGMTDEQISKLFDEYAQFNQKANRLKEGTGLGMSITHKLISLMKGSIKIESAPGKGSAFTVRLPQGKCVSGVLGKELAENLSLFNMYNGNHLNKIKVTCEPMPYGSILIVDDVEANIYVAKGLLAIYEIKIYSANNAHDAINRIKQGEVFDIIFMDHMMPVMDGIEATKYIRELGYTAPIIALSANVLEGQVEVFKQNGFDDFISKPIDLRHLNLLLNKYVRDKQPQEVLDEIRRLYAQRKQAQKNDENTASPVTNEHQTDSSKSVLNDMKIPGLDIAKGVKRFNGNEAAYLDVLRSYAACVNDALDAIETVDEKSLNSYVIKVHGIKGTSMDIYAEPVAAKAKSLEEAGKAGDLNYIKENHIVFYKDARELVNSIENMLFEIDKKSDKPLRERPDELILFKLIEACKSFDMGGAEEAMAELEKYRYEADNDLVIWLRNSVDRTQFEEIAAKLLD